MQFNTQHLVIIDSLEPNEAKAFVKFLESEIIRHGDDIRQAQELINQVIIRFGASDNYLKNEISYYKVDGHTIPVYKFGETK